jgi:hypothetical protein
MDYFTLNSLGGHGVEFHYRRERGILIGFIEGHESDLPPENRSSFNVRILVSYRTKIQEGVMRRRRFTVEQISGLLREAEVRLSQGRSVVTPNLVLCVGNRVGSALLAKQKRP